MTLWVSTQGPHGIRDAVAPVLGLEPDRLRVALRGGRRRVRTEAGHVRRVQPRGQSREDARPAGEVGRDPFREHALDAPRACAGHLRRARPQARRHDRRSARAHDRRRGRVSRRRRVPAVLHADDVAAGVPNPEDRLQLAGGDDQHHADRGVPRRRSPGGDASRRTHARHRRRRARHRSRRHPPHELHPERRVPVHDGHRRNVRHRRLREDARRGARARGLRRAARRAGGAPGAQRSDAARHRSGVVRRDHRAGRAAPRVRARSRSPTTAPCSRTSVPARTARATRPRSR